MNKQDILSILITLFAGFIAGMYLYVTGFAGITAKLEVSTADKYETFVIEGELYGGCRNRCDSFQILSDGSYRYLTYLDTDQSSVIRQGTLSFGLRRELRSVVERKTLSLQSREDNKTECPSYVDGVDVRYEVTVDGELYVLDSCTTQVRGQSELWVGLLKVWEEIREDGNTL